MNIYDLKLNFRWLMLFIFTILLLSHCYIKTIIFFCFSLNKNIIEFSYASGISFLNLELKIFVFIFFNSLVISLTFTALSFIFSGFYSFESKFILTQVFFISMIAWAYLNEFSFFVNKFIFLLNTNGSSLTILFNPDVCEFIYNKYIFRLFFSFVFSFGFYLFQEKFFVFMSIFFDKIWLIIFLSIELTTILKCYKHNQ